MHTEVMYVSKTEVLSRGFQLEDAVVIVEMAINKFAAENPDEVVVGVVDTAYDVGDKFEVALQTVPAEKVDEFYTGLECE